MLHLDALIEGYLAYKLDVARLVPASVRDIRCSLTRIVRTMRQIRPDVPLWQLSLQDYLRYVEEERRAQASPTCINKYLVHARGLLEYAWRSGRADRNVLEGFGLQDGERSAPPRVLTEEEAQQLVSACSRTTATERRERLMVLLLYGCGLRTHELCGLNVEHVAVELKELRVLTAKGDKPRVVPVPDGVFIELLAYLHERGGQRGPLFRTAPKRARLSNHHVAAVVARAVDRAVLSKDIKPKTLRHSFATHLMDRGVDLGVIASLMGHRSPQETGVYLHVLPGRKERAVRTIDRSPP